MTSKERPLWIGAVVAGALLGAFVGHAKGSDDEAQANYQRGYAAGKEACSGPSRLENAAKWLTEPR